MNSWQFLKLISTLREVIPVSSEDIIEAQIALEWFPNLPEILLLRTTLVHRPQDIPLFELVWQTIMWELENNTLQPTAGHTVPLTPEQAHSPGSGGIGIGQGTGGISLAYGNVKQPTPADIKKALAHFDFSQPIDSDIEETLKQLLGDINLYAWLNTQELAYKRNEISVDVWENAKSIAKETESLLRKEFLIKRIKQKNNWEELKKQYWKHKPLFSLNQDERKMVQTAIKQWGHKLAIHPGRRWKTSRHGILDFSSSIRHAWQNDGLIFCLKYHHKIPKVPELTVLCDISNSVAPYAEFLLFLVARLHQHFRKVSLFFFIDTLWDVTGHIWDEELQDLSEEIESWTRRVSSGYSDYGKVFREFAENNLTQISSKATVLIFGDAKNNYRTPQAEYLATIQERVHSVIWLNPLKKEEWLERDNALSHYQEFCSQIFRCRTVEDLYRIARHLMK